jgi:hypothetical protein
VRRWYVSDVSSPDFERLRIHREPEELIGIKAEFRKRQWRRLLILVPLTMAVLSKMYVLPAWLLVPLVPASVIAALLAVFSWRCPACERHFGRQNIAGSCPYCRVELE